MEYGQHSRGPLPRLLWQSHSCDHNSLYCKQYKMQRTVTRNHPTFPDFPKNLLTLADGFSQSLSPWLVESWRLRHCAHPAPHEEHHPPASRPHPCMGHGVWHLSLSVTSVTYHSNQCGSLSNPWFGLRSCFSVPLIKRTIATGLSA